MATTGTATETVMLKGGLVVSVDALQVLWSLESRGFEISEAHDLLVVGPKGQITPEDDQAIRAHRDELLLLVRYCETCSHTWRRPRGRLVPAVSPQPQLPGTAPALSMEPEWPDAEPAPVPSLPLRCDVCRLRAAVHTDPARPAALCSVCARRLCTPRGWR